MEKSRKKKNKKIRPDQVLDKGPLRLSRYGNKVIVQNAISPQNHKIFLSELANRFTETVNNIDEQIQETPSIPNEQDTQSSDVIDLTARFAASEDLLRWDVPPGHWVVLRFGMHAERSLPRLHLLGAHTRCWMSNHLQNSGITLEMFTKKYYWNTKSFPRQKGK